MLGFKKRGFGASLWNGFGGKVHPQETIEEACLRELKEESNLDAISLFKCAILDFWFEEKTEILQVHVFRADKFLGDPVESEEMRPQWFELDKIPFNDMWPDDRYWIPLIIQGKKVYGQFYFRGMNLLRYHISEDADISA